MKQNALPKKQWEEIEKKMLKAHEEYNQKELVRLYTKAGEMKQKENDENAEAFFLTHAYVFALESGSENAKEICKRLVKLGREQYS